MLASKVNLYMQCLQSMRCMSAATISQPVHSRQIGVGESGNGKSVLQSHTMTAMLLVNLTLHTAEGCRCPEEGAEA